MKLGIILDIQHAGRASKPSDLGASADLDGDGKVGRFRVTLDKTGVE